MMNLRLRAALATTLVAACFAPAPSGAQTTANGPYYATPSWDQTLPAATRFVVLSNFANEAALDRETGLVWQRRTLAVSSLYAGLVGCFNSTAGGRFGWRAPTMAELTSVFDPTNTTPPHLPTGHPFLSFPSFQQSPVTTFVSTTPSQITGALAENTVMSLAMTQNSITMWPQRPDDGGHVLCVRAPS